LIARAVVVAVAAVAAAFAFAVAIAALKMAAEAIGKAAFAAAPGLAPPTLWRLVSAARFRHRMSVAKRRGCRAAYASPSRQHNLSETGSMIENLKN